MNRRNILIAPALLIPGICLAAGESTGTTYFSNALFNTLLLVIVILAFMVWGLSGALKTYLNSEAYREKIKKQREEKSTGIRSAVLLLAFSLTFSDFFAGTGSLKPSPGIGGLDHLTFYTMISLIACELLALLSLASTFKKILVLDE